MFIDFSRVIILEVFLLDLSNSTLEQAGLDFKYTLYGYIICIIYSGIYNLSKQYIIYLT